MLVLGLTASNTLRKGFQQRDKEVAFRQDKEAIIESSKGTVSAGSSPPREMTPFAGGGLQSETSEKSSIAPLLPPEQLFDHENSQLLLRTAKLENTSAWAQLCGDDAVEPPRRFPVEKLFAMLCLWGIHISCLVYAGGPFALLCGEFDRQMVLCGNILVQSLFTLYWRSHCLEIHRRKQKLERALAGAGGSSLCCKKVKVC